MIMDDFIQSKIFSLKNHQLLTLNKAENTNSQSQLKDESFTFVTFYGPSPCEQANLEAGIFQLYCRPTVPSLRNNHTKLHQ